MRAALQDASIYGIGESYPFVDDASLPDQAAGIASGMQRRADAASAAGQTDTQIMAALFGQDFLFLPRFQLSAAAAAELDLAITQGPTTAPHDFTRWMQQAARVRPALDAWRRLTLYTGALEQPPADFELAQLPFQVGARWAALPFAPKRPPAGLVSLALQRPVKPATNAVWVGLFLDDWTEVIPDEVETTAVGFHYDDPGAEAGQAVLLAIPPGEAQTWDIVTFANILNETADLAKVRAVDLELLPALGQLLPAIFCRRTWKTTRLLRILRPRLCFSEASWGSSRVLPNEDDDTESTGQSRSSPVSDLLVSPGAAASNEFPGGPNGRSSTRSALVYLTRQWQMESSSLRMQHRPRTWRSDRLTVH